jgi:hypothetical protein
MHAAAAEAPRLRAASATLYPGDETLEVVGESYRQETLWKIVGGHRPNRVEFDTHAILLPDGQNEHDPNAIEVLINFELVGYLSRSDAAAYRPGLLRLMQNSENGFVALEAVIVGGGPRPDGTGFLGVFLHHDPADFGLASHHAHTGELHTGLSHAFATDREDDSYDLSWYEHLSLNDPAAIKQLRKLLESEDEPIDRHYMLAELERRLYRSRGAFASALDEYDVVCDQHDAEMATIRPVLLAKFGAIPVIDAYRQAAIRHQKAKDWLAMRDWVERGIAVYGDQAARPEALEDLHKRLAYAEAKIEAATRPKQRPARAKRVDAVHGVEIETLTCGACGKTYERVRARGRKPQSCPDCRTRAISATP